MKEEEINWIIVRSSILIIIGVKRRSARSASSCAMLIVSWNVAGWKQTVHRIDQNYGNSATRRRDPSAVLRDYLDRHQADIFCVQEAKIPLTQLESRSEPLQCAHVDGYESFWSCCVDSTKRGFNGVVTYCKKGTVASADARPLGSPDLDDQGRCVVTDHGKFVVFNVYVPAGGGQPLSYKMKFLKALRRAMHKQRRQHKKDVILVGDLNVSHTKMDLFWGSRRLAVTEICRQVREAESTGSPQSFASLPKWKVDLAVSWPKIESVLQSKKVVPVQTTNPSTQEKFEKYRMTVQLNGKQIFLGAHAESPGFCEYEFDFAPWYYTCADTAEQILAQDENNIAITTLAELMGKLAGIEWDQDLQRKIAGTDGTTMDVSPPRRWLHQEVLQEDGMIDALRHFYPNAEGRYTCWDQFRNRRYYNEGARIDFTLIDPSLLKHLQRGEVKSLRCACAGQHDPNSEDAALCAATANGQFQAVSFHGGGIAEVSVGTLNTQFGVRHTGIIYTPPSFSDHVAISLLLDDNCCTKKLELVGDDKATKAAQPHKKVRAIHSYFGVSSSSTMTKKSSVSRPKIPNSKETSPNIGDLAMNRLPAKRKGPMDKFLTSKRLNTESELKRTTDKEKIP
jgi:exodeoxyribonuclease III